MDKVTTINEYISRFPPQTQKLLEQMRKAIQQAAPDATEVISYGMPAFKQHGVLVYFAGYDRHIGFYPTSSGIKNFQQEFARYKSSKGAVQFPLDEPLPLDLVKRIVTFRVKEDSEKTALKKKKTPQAGNDFAASLSAPAQRALKNKGIHNLKQLSGYTEAEILALHGVGKSSIPKLQQALNSQGLSFKQTI
ncbi:DUF1801 domain-containing protein [Chitinophagaceae bacterium MMS25-I14]